MEVGSDIRRSDSREGNSTPGAFREECRKRAVGLRSNTLDYTCQLADSSMNDLPISREAEQRRKDLDVVGRSDQCR